MFYDPALAAAEIDLIPVVDRRNDEAAAFHRRAARMVDVLRRGALEQHFGIGAGEWLGPQIGASECGAVDGVVDARIAPDRSQDAMLDVIEAERLALDCDELLAPWADGEEAGRNVDVADASQGIVRKHGPDGDGVVEIDPESELLRRSELADWRRRESIDIGREGVAVGAADRAIGDAIDAVVAGSEIFPQKSAPCSMIDARSRAGVVLLPARPKLGPRRRQCLAPHEEEGAGKDKRSSGLLRHGEAGPWRQSSRRPASKPNKAGSQSRQVLCGAARSTIAR